MRKLEEVSPGRGQAEVPGALPMTREETTFDAFLSYAHADAGWVRVLAASRFAELLARHLDEESAEGVLSMLDRQPPPADPSPESGS